MLFKMTIADKTQFPMDLEEVVDCYTCIYFESIEGGLKTDYCIEKKKFVDFNKPCRKYYSRDVWKKELEIK